LFGKLTLNFGIRQFEPALANRILYSYNGLFEAERLLNKIECAELGRADGGRNIPVPGDHNDGRVISLIAKPLQCDKPVDSLAQPDIKQNAAEVLLHGKIETLLASRDRIDLKA